MIAAAHAIAFAGSRRLASGELAAVAAAAKAALDAGETAPVLIFDAVSSRPIDVDFRGSAEEVRTRLAVPEAEAAARGRGRPKLGVTAREVTLLPRHWDWLATQRGGASATLRRLVDDARRGNEAADALRLGRESLYRFITAMAGDAEGYEEATRALFTGDEAGLEALTAPWPTDIRAHALTLARPAFGHAPAPLDGLVPAKRRAAVDRALTAAFPGAGVEAAERMAWGASGAGVFKLTVGGEPCVLRIEGPPDPMRDPVRHYACLKIAAEAGVAPRLLYADAEQGVCLTAFVDGGSTGPSMFGAPQLVAAAEAVKRLHAAPLFPTLVPYLDALDGIMGQFARSGVASPDVLAAPLDLYARLCAVYPRHDPDIVSSHNDLNPSNVIFVDGRAWIVDWETGFAADRYADVAALANWFAADEASEALILAAYFGEEPNTAWTARFLTMRQINRLFYGALLIGSAMAERPGAPLSAGDLTSERFSDIRGQMHELATAEGRLRFGRAFIAEALHDAQTPRFQAALEAMRA
jgi:hypothetical protein